MTRLRIVLGIVAGVIMLASSAAHSLLGWPALRGALAAVSTPEDLVSGLRIGWQFGGVAMLVFACLVLATFVGLARKRPAPLGPPLLIGAAYVAFGAWAFVVSGLEPFFFSIFVVPGLMLVAAAWGPRKELAAGSPDADLRAPA